ncbi:hypothetical protein PINS_up000766 [Pythium insidiosum]|nr:hypothetical protein PINS_up000766 [Pythium insidiosum]
MMKGCVRKIFVGDVTHANETGEKAATKRSIDVFGAMRDAFLSDDSEAAMDSDMVQAVANELLSNLPQHTRVLIVTSKWRRVIPLLTTREDLTLYELHAQDSSVKDSLSVGLRRIHSCGNSTEGDEVVELKASPDNEIVETVRRATPVSIDCIVDLECLFRAFRSQPKKHSALLLRRLVNTLLSLRHRDTETRDTPVFISLTPRKDWRKPEFLAHEDLGFALSTTALTAASSVKTALYLHTCHARRQVDVATLPSSTEANAVHHQLKTRALDVKARVLSSFKTRMAGLPDTQHCSLEDARTRVNEDVAAQQFVVVRGIVQHVRRFSKGPSFVSLAPRDGPRQVLQVALECSELAWTTQELEDLVRIARKGDDISVLGILRRNAQQQPIIRASALRFHASEFQEYE